MIRINSLDLLLRSIEGHLRSRAAGLSGAVALECTDTGERVTLEFGGGEVRFVDDAPAAERVALTERQMVQLIFGGHSSCEPLDLPGKRPTFWTACSPSTSPSGSWTARRVRPASTSGSLAREHLTACVSLDTLFRMPRNILVSETNLLDETAAALRSRLPPGWSLDRLGPEIAWPGRIGTDATFALTDSQGASATVMVEAKRRPVEARQVSTLLDQWQRTCPPRGSDVPASGNVGFMVVAPFLGPSARERLAEAGISYADATGNIRFVTNRPAAFIETQGAVRNPWRETVRLRSLQGRRSAAWCALFWTIALPSAPGNWPL